MKLLRRLLLLLAAAAATLAVAMPAGASTRPQWVGAHQGNNLNAWNAMNTAVGPSQIGREFFSGSLPADWSGAWASQRPAPPPCGSPPITSLKVRASSPQAPRSWPRSNPSPRPSGRRALPPATAAW